MSDKIVVVGQTANFNYNAVNATVTLTNANVIEALDKIKEIPKQTSNEIKEVIRDIDISSLQDLIDIDWGTLAEWADILIKFLSG
jgi:hypothetical protein